ncbi:MAG: IS66 family transposase [Vibrionaceae bacterium]
MTEHILALEKRIAELEQLLAQKDAIIAKLEAQWRLAQQKQFGKSAEEFVAPLDEFNEAEKILEQAKEELKQLTRPRQAPKRKPLPQHLPRQEVIHDIEDKKCPCCQGPLHKIGEDKSEKLEFIPAKIKVIVHVRPKYACRACENTQTSTPIKQAPMPPTPIKKGIATASLLSQIITSKFQFALPLYRLEALFAQHDIELSRQTMSSWIGKSALLLKPLVERLRVELLQQSALHADETPVNVLQSEKTNSYMWVYCSGRDSPDPTSLSKNIVLYDFHDSRAGRCASDFLQGYQGYLHVDGYQGYETTQATLVGCWAHARRKFIEAKKLQPKNKTGKADVALAWIQRLYAIESKLKNCSVAEKYAARQKDSLPILQKLREWLDQNQEQVIGNAKLKNAINYMHNQWDKLIRYVDNGYLQIDNNRAERAVKPFVIGRKNWLFNNTERGAASSAILYSLVETAKANGLIPYDYLVACLNEMCQPAPDIERLLPWNFAQGVVG